MLVLMEICSWISTAVLVSFWIRYPQDNWEPWTVLCGLVAAVLDGVRRYQAHRMDGADMREVRRTTCAAVASRDGIREGEEDLYDESTTRKPPIHTATKAGVDPCWMGDGLISRLHQESLSNLLRDALEFAKQSGNEELERWCRLELYGYGPEGGLREGDSVPEYRGVTGRWLDERGRMLDLSNYDDLRIVNRYRFRFGVKKLEELAARTEMQSIADDSFRQLLDRYMRFNAVCFWFSPIEVVGVLDVIKSMLAEKVRDAVRAMRPKTS